jgi:predicted XRE-type DNA-binding protein
MTAITDQINLEEIKMWLEYGDQKAIAESLGIKNPERVSQVLGGHVKNFKILSACLDKAIERKAAILNRAERLKQLQ